LAAAITTFGVRSFADRRLAFALIAEPLGREADEPRVRYRKALAGVFEARIRAAIAAGHLPAQDAAASAAALVGALIEGLIGPLAPPSGSDPAQTRAAVQALTLFALRALGVLDARARGLVVQTQIARTPTA
jgi:hypothetical protein